MIQGTVNAHREAVVPIHIAGPSKVYVPLDTIVDTGFTASLTLPRRIVEELRLPLMQQRRAVLGDGREVVFDLYEVSVRWGEGERQVLAYCTNSEPLLGLSLLYGYQLTMAVVDGGRVAISPLPQPEL